MNFDIMNGTYYLIESETYESGKRVKLAQNLSNWYKQKEPRDGYQKVNIALYHGMFALIYEDGRPCLICTQGYIEFVS